jgi:hypothetical protein
MLALAAGAASSQETSADREAMIARAKALELDTPYVPPPGNPLEHHAAGFAKISSWFVWDIIAARPPAPAASARRSLC